LAEEIFCSYSCERTAENNEGIYSGIYAMRGGTIIMGKVYDMAAEIESEKSKKEIYEDLKRQAKNYLTEEQLKEFERVFYIVAKKYLFGAKKKE